MYMLGVATNNNSLLIIQPYWFGGTWVFDDPTVGLVREPFVAGVPEMIDDMIVDAGMDLDASREGITLLFSATPFPGYQKQVKRVREELGGNWYVDDAGHEGWLCPALFHYYDKAPETLYSAVRKS
jgi:hypothetical protein